MTEYDPEVEEIDLDDIELHEDEPEFEDSPTRQTLEVGNQDELEQGDDPDQSEEQEDPDA